MALRRRDILQIRDSAIIDPNIEIIKNPALTQLYNAIKFSGTNKKKLGIGFFNAVTAPMHAVIRDRITQVETKIETEPLANYNIIVLDQAFRGQSYLTSPIPMSCEVEMGGMPMLPALDLALYDKKNSHALNATFRYSKIWEIEPYDGFNAGLKFAK